MAADFVTFPFVKMHGLGNDFVMGHRKDVPPGVDPGALAGYVCDRHFGIGADGLILADKPTDPARFDIQFIYYNSDGSKAEMCGNGIRCFALFVRDEGLCPGDSFRVETPAGLMVPEINPDGTVRVDMGEPVLIPADIPFQHEGSGPAVQVPLEVLDETVRLTAVSMGNPHAVLFEDDQPTRLDPMTFGPALEKHPAFVQKTNVEFVEKIDDTTLKVTVWERGCGFTLACGTGACAVGVAAALAGKTGPSVGVQLPGGPLQIDWDRGGSNHVFMHGPAAYVFKGEARIPASFQASTPAG